MLVSFFIYIAPVFAMDISLNQTTMANNIKESLRNNPELWIIDSFKLFYFQDLNQANSARESAFPGVCNGVSLVLNYNVYQVEYVDIEEPFELEFNDEAKKMMVKEVKIFLYKYFRDQVGDEVEKVEQNIPINKPVVVEPIVEIDSDGMSKL
jgi:hypothetical protein